ncbi:response regulator [Geothrix sp. 21YS21S-4]|uniref:response regulator n=1 Tax=Geothrix sp. 21YS21S-4 TaxID=3068889 RepID=UPI0027B8BC78|nr:response regulator [Geothrix sp. 21YS21S-4]
MTALKDAAADLPRVLVVEDEPINLDLLRENLEFEGYRTTGASSGEEAWRLISERPDAFDVILLDRVMPDMDGIEVLRRIKARPGPLQASVIMQTSRSSDLDIVEGLKAGAYYYLTKPFTAQALLAIVGAAARDRQGYRALQLDVQRMARTLGHLTAAEFRFRTPCEAREIAALVAKATPNPERTVNGLTELMLNAVEHGNLGLAYAETSRLLAEGRFNEEVARRLELPEHREKRATLLLEREGRDFRFTIRDEGPGFAWQDYLELNPERAFHLHGRGIAMSRRTWFDRLDYPGCGNEVVAAVQG